MVRLTPRRAALPIQLGVVGVFFATAFTLRFRYGENHGGRFLENDVNNNGTIYPIGCEAKMAKFYGDQCKDPYCEDLVGGFINYFRMHTCDLADSPALSFTILVTWLLVQFWLLADTADAFFVPILQQIVVLFAVQPALAGITFLSFGNGAPDVFATIAAFSQGGNAADIGIGSLLGSGMFVTTVVLALVAFQSDGTLKRRPFMRDIICYLATLSWLMYIVYSLECTLIQALIFVVLYICFVCFVIVSRNVYLKYYKTTTGATSLDESLLDGDDLQGQADLAAKHQEQQAARENQDNDDGNLFDWDGGLRLKIRAMNRASVASKRQSRAVVAHGRQRGFQSLTAAEYNRRLDRSNSLGAQQAPRRLRAASDIQNGGVNYGGDNNIFNQVSATIDHAGGWADAANKVQHQTQHGDNHDANADGNSTTATGKLSMVDILQGMINSMITDFQEQNLFGKVTYIICGPLTLLRRLSIPVLGNNFFEEVDENENENENVNALEEQLEDEGEEEEEEEDGFPWSKPFACVSCIFLPVMCGYGCVPDVSLGPIYICWIMALAGVVGAVFMANGTAHHHPPRRRSTAIVLLVLGFIASILWIYFIANELVTILEVLGILCGIPNSVLGLTVLAWANSAPDTISIVGVAKQGYVQMAIGGVYAGRMFDTLCGLGLGLTVATIKAGGPITLHPDLIETISFATLLLSVVSAGIIVPLSGFKYTKPFAIALLILYFLFLLLGLLAAANVFSW